MREVPFDPDNDDLMQRLRNVPVFDSLPESHIREAMRAASIRRYEAGETIIHEGEYGEQVFFLIFGKLAIESGGAHVGALQRLGDVFGEMGIIDDSPLSATIKAERTSLVISLDKTAIGKLGDSSKIFTQAVMYRIFAEVLAVRLREANCTIIRLEDELRKLRG